MTLDYLLSSARPSDDAHTQHHNDIVDAVNDIVVGAGGLAKVTHQFTAVELIGITDANPFELVAATAHTIHAFYEVTACFKYGTVPYTDGADLYVTNALSSVAVMKAIAGTTMRGTANKVALGVGGSSGFGEVYGNTPFADTDLVNKPILLALDPGASPNTPFAAGDSILSVSVLYMDIPFPT